MSPPNKSQDPFDPAVIALRLVEVEGRVDQTQQALTNATQNMGSAVQSMQIDVRHLVGKMDGLATMTARQAAMEDEIERAFTAVRELADASKEKWDEHHQEQSGYRQARDHEIRSSREKLILWGGIVSGFSILAAALTAIVAWSVNSRFENQARDHDKLDERVERNSRRIDDMDKDHGDKINNMEKYLIRGGAAGTGTPYNGNTTSEHAK